MNKNNLRAVVLGATGLVGSELVNQLISDNRFSDVLLLTRRKTHYDSEKIRELIVNFDLPEEWVNLIKGDVLFSAFGTTIKRAGSQANQFKIDYSYQLQVARAASKNGISSYVLISALGANANSKIFYNRIKGELDVAVQKLKFENLTILKPSFLDGKRKERRVGEKIGLVLGRSFNIIPGLRAFRPIQAEIVAKAMVNAVFKNKQLTILKSAKIFDLANS